MPKIVSLSEAADEALDRLKDPGDSFSDVVLRVAETERRRRLLATFGSGKMTDKEDDSFVGELHERRRQSKPGAVKS